jgi:hypothetical protein
MRNGASDAGFTGERSVPALISSFTEANGEGLGMTLLLTRLRE